MIIEVDKKRKTISQRFTKYIRIKIPILIDWDKYRYFYFYDFYGICWERCYLEKNWYSCSDELIKAVDDYLNELDCWCYIENLFNKVSKNIWQW